MKIYTLSSSFLILPSTPFDPKSSLTSRSPLAAHHWLLVPDMVGFGLSDKSVILYSRTARIGLHLVHMVFKVHPVPQVGGPPAVQPGAARRLHHTAAGHPRRGPAPGPTGRLPSHASWWAAGASLTAAASGPCTRNVLLQGNAVTLQCLGWDGTGQE